MRSGSLFLFLSLFFPRRSNRRFFFFSALRPARTVSRNSRVGRFIMDESRRGSHQDTSKVDDFPLSIGTDRDRAVENSRLQRRYDGDDRFCIFHRRVFVLLEK